MITPHINTMNNDDQFDGIIALWDQLCISNAERAPPVRVAVDAMSPFGSHNRGDTVPNNFNEEPPFNELGDLRAGQIIYVPLTPMYLMSPNQDLGEVTIYELVRSLGKFLTLDPNISFDFRPNNASFLVTIADTENGVDSCFEVNFYPPRRS